ncbi:MAG TPA: hypothetical protein VLH08_20965 [Acidobacteriota bacterium]|nr:hypothetical protein [Acidobacteriota bacterium]
MNKVGSATSNVYPGHINNDVSQAKSAEVQRNDPPASNEKSVKQEAKTREKDSELQATVRKEALFAQVEKSTTEAPRFVERNLKSEEEVRKVVSEKAFPALMQGLEKAGLTKTDAICNLAASMMVSALKKQGIEGARIRQSAQHTFVEVPTKKGTLLLDPTASQFFKEGTGIHSKLKKEGFIGTEQELKQMIRNNVEHWKFDSNISPDPEALAITKGKPADYESKKMAEAQIDDLQKTAELRYFSGEKGWPGQDAIRQTEWYEKGDLNKPFINQFQHDLGPSLKTAYETMEQLLK